MLFGTSCDRDCYISRSNVFEYVEAESYYYVKIMMKITNNNNDKAVQGLTTGRIQWVTIDNSSWSTDKQIDFDITADDKWRLYLINMGPKQKWQGDINNLRIYPFIDGWLGDEFAIKFIKISSLDKWACSNTQCSYYTQYTHPCCGAGKRANCESGITKSEYTTISGVSDKLIININNYGNEEFALGNNINVNGIEMARIVGNKLSTVGIGGYAFAEVEYSENDKLKINTGNTGSDSSIKIEYSSAAEALGFYDGKSDISTYENGEDTADGFDYASSRVLRAFEINRLIDGDKENFAYIHNPNQYNVEGGRRDFNEIGTSRLISELGGSDYYESLSNKGRTLIELSHPINSNGRLKAVYLYGKIDSLSKVKICRPQKNGELEVIHTLNLPLEDDDKLYTTIPVNYRLDCNILVNKGDLIGIYNADLYVGVSISGYPDATFYQIAGEVKGTFDPGKAYTFGVAGFAIYARSDRYQNNVILDIDFGNRINIEEVNLYGKEEADYFEFNIASCLDLNWQVDLFGQSHYHAGTRWTDGTPFYHVHQNIAYGKECLDDCIVTVDNGKAGDSYGKDANGLWTSGGESYFYVNGDAEWLYSFECTGKTEYCWPYVPGSALGIRTAKTSGFVYDPVAFTLTFPYGFKSKIHKSIIYFKEKNNFRSIALSYYLGSHDSTGNADTPYFKLIPKYNSISLDGILYDETNNERNKDYIFKNPTNQKVIYVNGEAQNWEEYEAAVWTDWTILEHNFDPIECCGFRIYTNHHYSTKIMELEVYSKIETTSSLLDNISLSFSDYDDVWKSASFSEISSEEISAFVGGEPRHITLELESSTEFSINEIEALVGNQVKLEDCENDILLEESKTGVVNKSMPVVLENIYDKPFDLIVDIPKETSDNDDIIFWNKLESQEEIDNSEIGPGCILHKNDDYEIRNDNCQCAVNVLCYGLKNLVDNKEAYYNLNDEDWLYYGTLSSGTSVDFYNYASYKESIFTFDAVSSKYWKIASIDVSNLAMIKDVIVYYNDDRMEIKKIYGGSDVGSSSQLYGFDSNGTNIVAGYELIIDDFEDGVIDSRWTIGGIGTLTESNGKITVSDWGSGGGSSDGPTMTYEFDSDVSDFAINSTFIMKTSSNSQLGHYIIQLLDSSDTEVLKLWITDSAADSFNIQEWLYNGDLWIGNNFISYSSLNFIELARVGNTVKYTANGEIRHTCVVPTTGIKKIVLKHQRHYSHPPPDELSTYDFSMTIKPALFDNVAFGFKLNTTEPVNKIKLIHQDSTLNTLSVYTSPDNTNNYVLIDDNVTGNLDITINNQNYYNYFVIDLEKRHDIDIIRNYGEAINKLFISTGVYADYSNSVTSNVNNVEWDNSDKDDVRWLRIKLLCGDDTARCIRKLGIYPDISNAYCIGGGYNCEWKPFGNILSDYTPSINVAYGATVIGTNYYFRNYYPDNAVDGIFDNYEVDSCWGFQKVDSIDPYIEIDFGAIYKINKIKLYHGYDPGDDTYMNKNYNLGVSTSISGSFTNVLNVTNNSEHEVLYQFDPVDARRIRLTITDYDYGRYLVYDEVTQTYEEFKGSFLREVEIYTYIDTGYIDSETWPVVCMNLKDRFNIVGHDLINKDVTDTDTDWDNSEDFFKYSDNIWDDPEKISFTREGDYVVAYEKIDTSGSSPDYAKGSMEYLFDDNIYFEEGKYNVEWDAYEAEYENEISLRLEGNYTIDYFADNLAVGWVKQTGVIDVPEAGFYSVKGKQHITPDYSWGVRNPSIYRSYGLSKWIGVKRDTAENYSYDDDSDKYGKDYLSLIRIYGEIKYNPLEYNWWWSSSISSLDNDSINVKVGSKSLKISYPTSSGIDVVSFIEGDTFGEDVYYSPKDVLTFWWLIEDINKLDATFGDIIFGILNDAEVIYYQWRISSLNLVSGWNRIRLRFEDYDVTSPLKDLYSLYGFLDEELDFRTNRKDFQSFRLRYRGKGQPFTMNIDNLKIERNKFEDDVKFEKGLCLTGQDFLEIPISGITLEKGTIEFYLKLYCDSYGRDLFGQMNSRTLFTLTNNANNIIALNIKSGNWLEVVAGQIRKNLILFNIEESNLPLSAFIERDEVVHFGLAWDNGGEFMDDGSTLRFYINNELICGSKLKWVVGDTKSINLRIGGHNTELSGNRDFWGSGIFDNLKIYNFCKTDFNINVEGIEKDVTYVPNDFIEISKNDIDYYGIESKQLPLIFQQIPAGEKRTIYVRSNKNINFKQSKKTAAVVVDWLVSV
jgi:hypothetical protein